MVHVCLFVLLQLVDTAEGVSLTHASLKVYQQIYICLQNGVRLVLTMTNQDTSAGEPSLFPLSALPLPLLPLASVGAGYQ